MMKQLLPEEERLRLQNNPPARRELQEFVYIHLWRVQRICMHAHAHVRGHVCVCVRGRWDGLSG